MENFELQKSQVIEVVSKENKPRLSWLFGSWLLVSTIWAASGFWLHTDSQRGTFGDMFGAVNALFTGLAFATLIYTTWMQREELALQREELASTRKELEGQKMQLAQQSATFALQRFEDSFFSLLRSHSEIVGEMDLVDEGGATTKARDCFKVWYKRLRTANVGLALNPSENTLQSLQAGYEKFYAKHQAEVGHYFRHLYHILKFVKDSSVENKRKYSSLVRAQLSGYEHLLLFYNCLSNYGYKKFKPLVEEFSLLENLPKSLLIDRAKHTCLYEASAFGDDGVA